MVLVCLATDTAIRTNRGLVTTLRPSHKLALLVPLLLTQHIRGNAQQPRAGAPELISITTAALERDHERPGSEIVGPVAPGAPRDVAMNHPKVPVENLRKRLGGGQRFGDRRPIGASLDP